MLKNRSAKKLHDSLARSQYFDAFAESYRSEMASALGRFGGESSYYLNQKVSLLKNLLRKPVIETILDFGSGIGQAVPFLIEAFTPTQLVCTDESTDSLRVLQTVHPNVLIREIKDLPYGEFDLIFVANVLHHVVQWDRQDLIRDLSRRLKRGGTIAIFEHNPINPVTRKIVSNCSFDEGVQLLKMREVKSLIGRLDKMKILESGYCLFVPEPLKMLNWVERPLRRLPFGGQHFVIASHT